LSLTAIVIPEINCNRSAPELHQGRRPDKVESEHPILLDNGIIWRYKLYAAGACSGIECEL